MPDPKTSFLKQFVKAVRARMSRQPRRAHQLEAHATSARILDRVCAVDLVGDLVDIHFMAVDGAELEVFANGPAFLGYVVEKYASMRRLGSTHAGLSDMHLHAGHVVHVRVEGHSAKLVRISYAAPAAPASLPSTFWNRRGNPKVFPNAKS